MDEIDGVPNAQTRRTSVALIRGEALNPFELQAYAPMVDEFDIVAVGRRRPNYEVDLLPVPTMLLPSMGTNKLVRAIHRRASKAVRQRIDPDDLRGLAGAVQGRQILHAAETILPISGQAARISRASGSKLILTCWETIPFRYDDNPVLAARKMFVRAQADLYIAVTQRARSALVAEGTDPRFIEVVPAAIDCDRFQPRPGPTPLRDEWGLSKDTPIVLYVGRLIQEKGIVELVRAFANTGNSHAQLIIVGNGDQADRIRIAASALGVGSRVQVRAGVSYQRIPELYNTADIVVAPSLTTPYWEEQFGMVLAEAMACGRPLLTTSSGAIPEVVGSAARLVEPYDNRALAQSLASLLADSAERLKLGEAARAWAVARYAVPLVSQQLAGVYRQVMQR